MEFQKIKLHRSEKRGSAVTQITLDDDYNVPDYRQDIVKVIKEHGELRFDEVKAMEEVQMVVEGVYSAKAGLLLAQKYGCDMPIVSQVNQVLFDGKSPKEALADLMMRDPRIESSDLPWEG